MSVRMRHTRAHTNNRRSHHALDATKFVTDKVSGKLRLPHRLDESTGTYRGKQIMTPKVKKAKEPHAHGTHHEHVHEDAPRAAKPAAAEKATKAKGHPNERSGPAGVK